MEDHPEYYLNINERLIKYNFINIQESIKKLITCLQKPSPSWSEIFLQDIRNVSI